MEQSTHDVTVSLEQKLVRQAQSNDPQARRALVELFKDRLYSFVLRMVKHHHDAEEICQEAFLKAFASLGQYSAQYRFSTWLFTIAYRVCLNTLRKKRSIFRAFESAQQELQAADEVSGDSEDSESMESAEVRQLKQQIWGSVDKLSAPQRATVILFYRNGYGCDEIGRILQVPVATVKSHLHRARAKLRTLLDTEHFAFSEEYRNLYERAV